MLFMALYYMSYYFEEQTSDEVLHVSHNEKYGLSVEFFGERVLNDNAVPEHQIIKSVNLHDHSDSTVIRYEPFDPETLEQTGGYFINVWSPDGEYLLLPLGRGDGFVVFSSKTAMTDMKSERKPLTIRVKNKSLPTALWHNFEDWRDEQTFRFSAGQTNSALVFDFDISNEMVTSQNPAANLFEAHINTRAMPIITDQVE